MFCGEESLGASVKAYMEFEKMLKEKLPKEQRAKVHLATSLTCRHVHPPERPSRIWCMQSLSSLAVLKGCTSCLRAG